MIQFGVTVLHKTNSRLHAEGARMSDLESGDVLVCAVRRQAETLGRAVADVIGEINAGCGLLQLER
jgi:hypothetical protein